MLQMKLALKIKVRKKKTRDYYQMNFWFKIPYKEKQKWYLSDFYKAHQVHPMF